MFQEAGDLDKDVHHLKRQVMAHRRLVQQLSANCLYSSSSASMVLPRSGSEDDEADAEGILLPDRQGERDEDLELDALLSEHRTDEAIQLLELQAAQALRTMQQQAGAADEAETVARALDARKARVAGRLASVAGNPRTPRPELLRALSGLCRLGDAEQANQLLLGLHRGSVVRGVEELRLRASQGGHLQLQSSGAGSSNYIKDLARVVFSSIVRTSRGFVALHGHPSPYTARLVRWAREEMEDLSAAFSEYVRSVSSPAAAAGHSLALALDAAECAVSYTPLLRAVDIVDSERDVVGLVVPCVRDAVTMYGRHLKEVVRLLVDSDAWVLGRFLVPPGLMMQGAGAALAEYCLLTTNGRKFVTLIQEVVEDVAWPLHKLGIGTNDSVGLQLVAELFREYMHSIVELIPRKEAAAALQDEASGDAQYTWQLAVLINCTTLVSLFPAIASGVFRTPPSSTSGFPASAQREVDSLVSLVKEAAGQVWSCFCQQFVRDTMASSAQGRFGSGTPPPPQGVTMPSMAFQVVFLRVRRLTEVYGAIMSGDDGTTKKLLQELMEAMVCWLSTNLESWAVHGDAQAQLDVHFLLELAQLGGFSSESIRSSAMDLITKAQEKVAGGEQDDAVREERCGGWAADAAKHAVQVLLATEGGDVAAWNDAGEERDEMARRSSNDEEAGQEEAPEGENEDHEDETGAANKSSDEFVSMEDDEDEDEGEEDGVRMPARAALSSESSKPGHSELGNGEEMANIRSGHHHPELDQAEGGGDDSVQADDETRDGEGMCHDAIQQQVEEQSSSSWEDIDGEGGGGGRSSTRRQSTPPVMATGKDAPTGSRKKREAVSRSSKPSKPRWHV